MSEQHLVSTGEGTGSGRRIRRLALPIVVVWVMAAGSLATAQKKPYPIFTQDNYVSMMKTVGRNFAGVNVALSKDDFETAKAQLIRAREQLAITITFWRDNNRQDAIKMLRDTLAKIDDLDGALSAEKIDPAAAKAVARQVSAACEACHAVYRDQDPVTKAYRLKPGSVQ